MLPMRTTVALVVIALLLLARAGMPLGYYTFLRIAVCASAIYLAWNGHKHGRAPWVTVAFVLLAILYNPVLPVYLGSKAAWAPVNLGTAVLYLVLGVQWRKA